MASKRIKIGGIIKDAVMRDLAQAFTTLGYKAALDAYKAARFGSKPYTHRTYNLHDSYGSAVYLDGKLVDGSIKYVNRGRSKSADKRAPSGYETGRQALETYFKEAFVVRKKDNYTILVASAMWYASMLEKKHYTVLPYDKIKESVLSNFDKVVMPVLKKHNIESLMPALRKGIGVDNEYFRFGGDRNPNT